MIVEKQCSTCKYFDGREGIEDCRYPNAENIPDNLDEECQQWRMAPWLGSEKRRLRKRH